MKIIFYVCISLSMGGSTLMLTHLFFFDNLKLFAQKVVACLSISDFIYAFGLLLYVEPQFTDYDHIRCTIQGAVTQFATISAFLWSASIAYFSYISITQGQKGLQIFVKFQNAIFLVGSFALYQTILALIPLFFNSYAPTPSKVPTTCSISSDDMNKSIDENRNLSLFLNLGLFYIPLLLSVVVSVFFILRTYFKIKKIKSEYELLTRQINIQLIFSRNLILYPLALFLCWLPSQSIFFIYVINPNWLNSYLDQYDFDKTGPYQYIRIFQYGMSFLQGFSNSLVYWFNSYQMRKKLESLERISMEQQKTQTMYSNNNESIRSSQVSNSLENLQDI